MTKLTDKEIVAFAEEHGDEAAVLLVCDENALMWAKLTAVYKEYYNSPGVSMCGKSDYYTNHQKPYIAETYPPSIQRVIIKGVFTR